MNITVFLGAPGSGKGTQAKRLVDTGKFVHFSTGDILRASIKEGKEVGLKAKAFMDKGSLVPDNVMIELIEEALSHLSENTKVILDGFPRTVAQANALNENPKTRVNRVIHFKVPNSVLIERLTGRRVCKNCGTSFHIKFMPPKKHEVCDKCGSQLIQRTDDSADVVQHRLNIFESQKNELLSFYARLGKDIVNEIDANDDADLLQQELIDKLK